MVSPSPSGRGLRRTSGLPGRRDPPSPWLARDRSGWPHDPAHGCAGEDRPRNAVLMAERRPAPVAGATDDDGGARRPTPRTPPRRAPGPGPARGGPPPPPPAGGGALFS